MAMFNATDGLLVRAMDYAAARSRALTANIANANTPGYKRVDVSFATHLREVAGRRLRFSTFRKAKRACAMTATMSTLSAKWPS
jgi:flagellar basal-body rod protein FlgB